MNDTGYSVSLVISSGTTYRVDISGAGYLADPTTNPKETGNNDA